MPEKKKPSFMTNVLTIIFSQVVVKLLGFAYRMVITNVPGFGNAGNGYYNYGFQIYTLLLALSSVGIPNAWFRKNARLITTAGRSGYSR